MRYVLATIFCVLFFKNATAQNEKIGFGTYISMSPGLDLNFKNSSGYSNHFYNDRIPVFGGFFKYSNEHVALRTHLGAESIIAWREKFGYSVDCSNYVLFGKGMLKFTTGLSYMFRNNPYNHIQQHCLYGSLGPCFEFENQIFIEPLFCIGGIYEIDKSIHSPYNGWNERYWVRINFGIKI